MKSMFNRVAPLPDESDELNSGRDEPRSLEVILAEIAPCQPTHSYLVEKGLTDALGKVDCYVYTGLAELKGISCHGAVAIKCSDIEGNLVNFQFIVPLSNGEVGEIFALKTDITGSFARIGKPSGTILVALNWTSGVSLHLGTGHAVAVAFTIANMAEVCKLLADKYPDTKIIVCADDDGSSPESTLDLAGDAATGIGALLAFPQSKSDSDRRTFGFNDLYRIEGALAVRGSVESATDPISNTGPLGVRKEVRRLAALGPVEYEQQRAKSAKSLILRANVLDKFVEEERTRQRAIAKAQSLESESTKPWPDPVDGNDLASQICQTIARFTVLPPYAVVAMMLWTIFAHLAHVMQVSPILVLFSPEKRCGKTTTLRLIELLTPRPLTASNITPAALFRVVQQMRPTLIIDEADTFIRRSEELNGIINSGHTRANAYVLRMEDGEPIRFSTWCAKAFAMIDEPPETMLDRSIAIRLRRKSEDECVEPLRFASEKEFFALKSMIARWANDNAANLTKQRPVSLGISNDRARDNWEPLLLIASCMGEKWLKRAVAAAVDLSKSHNEPKSIGEELLYDIRYVLESQGIERILTVDLIGSLCADPEKAWKTFSRGRSISPRELASLLMKFGIRSKNLRHGRGVAKGYEAEQFKDAFSRYLQKRSD